MTQFLIKVVLTALIVAGASELGKRSTLAAAVLVSLPLSSVLALAWLYGETRDSDAVSSLAMSIFWLVVPSLAFFPTLVALLRVMPFWGALATAAVTTTGFYFGFVWAVRQVGVQI